ncbi:hypothetical protein MJ1HA_1133 [Metallosphaera sedula]|nr:hypothetical protein MJ1HA_1133 [Metallosphaera sedula]
MRVDTRAVRVKEKAPSHSFPGYVRFGSCEPCTGTFSLP